MQQPVGRISLVVLACELDNHAATVERLSAALDIHDWDGPADLPYFGLRNAVSHGSGLEIVAPLTGHSALSEHLRAHGEGVYAVVFGVHDLEQAMRTAIDHGLGLADPVEGLPQTTIIDSLRANNGGPVFPSYPQRFAVHREAIMASVSGVQFILGQLEPVA